MDVVSILVFDVCDGGWLGLVAILWGVDVSGLVVDERPDESGIWDMDWLIWFELSDVDFGIFGPRLVVGEFVGLGLLLEDVVAGLEPGDEIKGNFHVINIG